MPRKHAETHEGNGLEERRRAFWSGTLSFGLVSIPVELLPANRSGGAPLRMVAEDGTPLQRKYFCPKHDEEVAQDDLTHGYELDDGTVVSLTDAELESADPKKSRDIDLERFVDRTSIDPLYFERGYFLAPGSGSGKAYRLLTQVMEDTDKAGIATFVMREREYVVAIFAEKGLLRAQTLRFHDEVRTPAMVGLPKKAPKPDAKLVKQFTSLIGKQSVERFSTAELTDEHAEALKALAEKKKKAKKDVVQPDIASDERPDADVIDLMAVLKKSLQSSGATKSHAREAQGHATSRRRKAGKRRATR